MSIGQTLQIKSISSEETENIGQRLGQNLKGGEVIELISDLGGGKTTFTRGLAKGAGSTSHVSSPTFKISNEYKAPEFTIVHFDFYRLHEAGIVANEIAEVANDPSDVVLVEWGEIVQDVLPKDRLVISIKRSGEDERQLTFTCPEKLNYLLEGLS